jgi:hypothetical protein
MTSPRVATPRKSCQMAGNRLHELHFMGPTLFFRLEAVTIRRKTLAQAILSIQFAITPRLVS